MPEEDVVESCIDYVTQEFEVSSVVARQLVAAFFGYASFEGLQTADDLSLENLELAAILLPDLACIEKQVTFYMNAGVDLYPRSSATVSAKARAEAFMDEIVEHLRDADYFSGQYWNAESIEQYLIEEYLPSNIYLDDELADVLAETNAYLHPLF